MHFDRTSNTHGSLLAGLALLTWLAPGTAGAGIEIYTPVDVGGFVANSSDSDPVFQAAAEATANAMDLDVTHLTFEFEADGTPLPFEESAYPGTTFSRQVTFRSPDADGSSPELVPENVLLVGSELGVFDYRLGAIPGYKGALELDFAGAAGAVNLLGLGIVYLDSGAQIQFFDADDAALATYTLPANVADFAFVGFETTEGDQIGRIVIEQSEAKQSYALQDVVSVPEPCAALLQFTALATLLGLSRKRLHALRR